MRESDIPNHPEFPLLDDPGKRLLLQVHILYELLPSVQWVNLAAALLVCGLLVKEFELDVLSRWLAFVLLVFTIRVVISNSYQRAVKSPENAHIWFNWFLIGTTLYGLMWSATAMLLVPVESVVMAGFTGLLLCGLVAGAVAVSSVNLEVFLVYAVSTMWPFAVLLIASQQYPQFVFGWLILVFFALLVLMAIQVNRYFSSLVNLQLKVGFLESEVKKESKKRELAEKALLDNTLEEGIADLIRSHARKLGLGVFNKPAAPPNSVVRFSTPAGDNSYQQFSSYIEQLHDVMTRQVTSASGFIVELKKYSMSDEAMRYVSVIEKILFDAVSSLKKIYEPESITSENIKLDKQTINLRRVLLFLTHGEVPLVYKAKLITIKRQIAANVPQVVIGDEKRLKEILRQLLVNAYKNMDGGIISLNVDVVSESDDKIILEFSVVDTGIGINQEIIDGLLEQDGKQLPEGTGLDEVKILVSLQGGELIAKSTLGAGTTIGFRLEFLKEHTAALSG